MRVPWRFSDPIPLPYVTQDNTPPGSISKLGYSAPSKIPMPADTFSDGCQRGLSNDTLFDIDIDSDVE